MTDTINIDINIPAIVKRELIPLPEEEEKAWSYSNVYYLRDLRDIYLMLYEGFCGDSIKAIWNFISLNNIQSENEKNGWTERKILEYLNALKNFKLIDAYNTPIKGRLYTSSIGDPLSNVDKQIFCNIYFSYFRFKMFLDFFKKETENPTMVYAYMEGNRFFNRFYTSVENTEYYLLDEHSDAMRFWDVTLKWGKVLGVLNRCPLSILDVSSNYFDINKTTAVCLSRDIPSHFKVLQYILEHENSSMVYIPNAIWKIVMQFGYSVEQIKTKILTECLLPDSPFCLQKASAIFVSNKEAEMLPIANNAYMSHLLKL